MKVNNREIKNPIEKFFWGVFAFLVTAWTLWWVFIVVIIILVIVLGIIFAPIWIPLALIDMFTR